MKELKSVRRTFYNTNCNPDIDDSILIHDKICYVLEFDKYKLYLYGKDAKEFDNLEVFKAWDFAVEGYDYWYNLYMYGEEWTTEEEFKEMDKDIEEKWHALKKYVEKNY